MNIALISDYLIKLMKLPVTFFENKLLGDSCNATQSVQNARAMDFELTTQEFDFIHKPVNEF